MEGAKCAGEWEGVQRAGVNCHKQATDTDTVTAIASITLAAAATGASSQ